MKIEEARLHFLNIVEKNGTNNNLNIDRPRFIEWFNFTNSKYQENTLKNKKNDTIREMAPFLLYSPNLGGKVEEDKHTSFTRPEDFFDLSNVFIEAKKGKCVVTDFTLTEEKSENIHIKLTDTNYKPSFKARETFYHLIEDSVLIYHNADFDINSAKLLYYKAIPDVDIEGYEKEDGTPSTNIDPQTDTKTTINILELMAVLFITAQGDLDKYQANLMNYKQV